MSIDSLHKSRIQLVATIVVAALIGAYLWNEYGQAGAIRTSQIIIEDSEGRPRVVLHEHDGMVGMALLDADGKQRAVMATNEKGVASVDLYDPSQERRISIKTTPLGEAMVSHYGPDGARRITSATMPDGFAGIEAYKRDGSGAKLTKAQE